MLWYNMMVFGGESGVCQRVIVMVFFGKWGVWCFWCQLCFWVMMIFGEEWCLLENSGSFGERVFRALYLVENAGVWWRMMIFGAE